MNKVDNKQFVEAWVEAKKTNRGQQYIEKKLGIARSSISSKAAYLRQKGVRLPKLYGSRHDNTASVSELNQLIKSSQF